MLAEEIGKVSDIIERVGGIKKNKTKNAITVLVTNAIEKYLAIQRHVKQAGKQHWKRQNQCHKEV